MRVTLETKARTRRAILKAAGRLFERQGFAQTSTRDIAAAAGIASGTLFNYFASKEELAGVLLEREFEAVWTEMEADSARRAATLDEALFDLIARQLRRLERKPGLVEGALAGLLSGVGGAAQRGGAQRGAGGDGAGGGGSGGDADHMAVLLRRYGHDPDAAPATLHLYRALHAGVLSFRLRDRSPGCEDTLAMLDRATRMFVDMLGPAAPPTAPYDSQPGENA